MLIPAHRAARCIGAILVKHAGHKHIAASARGVVVPEQEVVQVVVDENQILEQRLEAGGASQWAARRAWNWILRRT